MTGPLLYQPPEAILAAHARLLARYGGAAGVRSPGGIEAALARAERLRADADAFARIHHPFVDGNKRVAFYAAFAISCLNGWMLDVAEGEAATAIRW